MTARCGVQKITDVLGACTLFLHRTFFNGSARAVGLTFTGSARAVGLTKSCSGLRIFVPPHPPRIGSMQTRLGSCISFCGCSWPDPTSKQLGSARLGIRLTKIRIFESGRRSNSGRTSSGERRVGRGVAGKALPFVEATGAVASEKRGQPTRGPVCRGGLAWLKVQGGEAAST
jgi:hypothetical protein